MISARIFSNFTKHEIETGGVVLVMVDEYFENDDS